VVLTKVVFVIRFCTKMISNFLNQLNMRPQIAVPLVALGLGLAASEGCHHHVDTTLAFTAEVTDEEFTLQDMMDSGLNSFRDAARVNAMTGVIDCPQTEGRGYPSYVAAETFRCAEAMEESVTMEQVEGLWANAVEANLNCGQRDVESFNKWFFEGDLSSGISAMICFGQIVVDFDDALGRAAQNLSTIDLAGYEPCWAFDVQGNYFAYEQDPNNLDDPTQSANGGCYAE